MIRKLLLILCITASSIVFSQENSIEELAAAPNPFTNSTNITFTSPNKGNIILNVKNILGKSVFKKTYETEIGKNTIIFYKNDLATGIYIYSVQDKKKVVSKRFVIQ